MVIRVTGRGYVSVNVNIYGYGSGYYACRVRARVSARVRISVMICLGYIWLYVKHIQRTKAYNYGLPIHLAYSICLPVHFLV